jgi:hypothetical protein
MPIFCGNWYTFTPLFYLFPLSQHSNVGLSEFILSSTPGVNLGIYGQHRQVCELLFDDGQLVYGFARAVSQNSNDFLLQPYILEENLTLALQHGCICLYHM